MTDIVLVPVTGGNNISAMNNNFDKIEEAINTDILHLKGGNNVMKQDLDLNGHQLLNHETDLNDPDSLINVGDADARYYNVSGDALAGNMNAAGNKILNLPVANAPHEPMRKNEVDVANAAQDAVTAANNSKSLRFPEAVSSMSSVALRANKLQGYDAFGNPVPVGIAGGPVVDADQVLWQREDLSTSIATVQTALDTTAINLWEFASLAIGYGVGSPETWNWAPALQGAINQVIAYAESINRSYGIPAIEVPGGKYKLNTAINTKPWVKIKSNGPVVFDFTSAATSSHGFICDNFTTITQDDLRWPANHSPFLDGTGGTIAILGVGKSTSTGHAIRMGNFAPGGQQCRDMRLMHVVVTGWAVAQSFGSHNTYLSHTDNCRFEGNGTAILTSATNSNSGERMEWVNCTFAGADVVASHNCEGFDLNFVDCSFDFNGNIIKYSAASVFTETRMSNCYFEAFDGYIADGSLLSGSAASNQVAFAIDSPIILARDRTGANPVNSPSRTLFTGPLSLSITNPKFRYEKRHYIEDGQVVSPTVTLVGSSGYHVNPVPGPITLSTCVNADFDFQRDAAGTNADALTDWERVAGSIGGTITTRDIFDLAGKKVLRIVAATGTDTTTITFRSRNKIPCRAGDEFFQNLTLNANLATGSISVNAWMEFFNDADVSLGMFPAFAQYIFRDALNDSTLPNFGEGNNRWMDTQGFRSIAPKNTAYGKMRFALNTFDNTLYVSRARAWKVGGN